VSAQAWRWAWDWLAEQPDPDKGGPSPALRQVLLALAGHAHHRTGKAWPAAPTVAKSLGYSERWVRHLFDELADGHGFMRERRPGRTDMWLLPPIGPRHARHLQAVDDDEPGDTASNA
jgi:hypothetical protein